MENLQMISNMLVKEDTILSDITKGDYSSNVMIVEFMGSTSNLTLH